MTIRVRGPRFAALLTASALTAAPTWLAAQPTNPAPENKPAPIETRALLKSLEEQGKRYAQARKSLARGKPDGALKILKTPSGELLRDREELLRGDALLALRQSVAARDAYLRAQELAANDLVRLRALRGLVNVYGQIGQREKQLEAIEALLADRTITRRPTLMLERASVLARLGRGKEAAEAAWRVMLDYPTARAAVDAEQLLVRLRQRGIAAPVSSNRVELARIENVLRSGDLARAEKMLDELKGRAPELAANVALARAEIFKRKKQRTEEIEVLKGLYATPDLEPALTMEVLDRLGRAAMAVGDDPTAIRYFDELAERFPKSSKSAEAEYLAAWLPYNARQYSVATQRFLDFAERFKKWRRRPEALWFAGWSAYLGGDFALARRAFAQLLEQHPSSDMALWAHYWTGRIREQSNDRGGAASAYRNVLRIAPLSYMASLASVRLESLGEKVVMVPPREAKPASLVQVLELLGAERPSGVDRGIALHKGGVVNEALEELEAAHTELAKISDTRGRVMVAEMLDSLGAHHEAFLFATRITAGGADLITGEPYAWRAWRLAYPKAFWAEVQRAAEAHDVDPLFVLSIMRTESHFRPTARSPVGARGLMQLMPATAQRIGKVASGGRAHAVRFGAPESNIWLGAWYLKQLLLRYDGQVALAAGAYNAGPGAMDRWVAEGAKKDLDAFVENISYRETRQYIRRVLETYQIYRRLDAAPNLDLAWQVKTDLPKRADTVSF